MQNCLNLEQTLYKSLLLKIKQKSFLNKRLSFITTGETVNLKINQHKQYKIIKKQLTQSSLSTFRINYQTLNALCTTALPQNVCIRTIPRQQHRQRLDYHSPKLFLARRDHVLLFLVRRILPRLQKIRESVQARHEHFQQTDFSVYVLEYRTVFQDVQKRLHARYATLDVVQTVGFQEY